MTESEARIAVRATLAVMARLATTTRTQADDLLMPILHANETKLAQVVQQLSNESVQPPTNESMTAALAQVGLRG